ncbi:monofunctional biosynthetic peptidoglycan transglycosylase [Methylobacillus sp. MM3]|uniref:monofunctional biosynthetic peptidoglycan transglycosylase n=1 Tax=Methylobacillus sp. MM3 TaxID=1848039 RepID=UPI0007E14AFD|nr:monofunctional biosynthetic peptidoglycan transglycosylase [Methylobacillus sp. MM3]OAJ70644.1 monofunctional biosynthetic peptidoglycan transglycosylase [Methylobacillus sp. MM3]
MRWRGFLWRGLLALVVLVLVYQLWIFLHICWWVNHNPGSSAFMNDRLGLMQEKNPEAKLRHKWVPYKRISNNLKRAVVVAEDSKFVVHEGFDWDGIQKAYEKNLKKGRVVAGGSTISQQLAKNLFLSTQRTPWRKLQEAVITLMLEKMMSKRRILEIYLNVIEWGNGVFGAEAAARHYYGAGAASLSAWQSARLAAMIPNPRYYDDHRNARGLARRTATIAARMRLAALP